MGRSGAYRARYRVGGGDLHRGAGGRTRTQERSGTPAPLDRPRRHAGAPRRGARRLHERGREGSGLRGHRPYRDGDCAGVSGAVGGRYLPPPDRLAAPGRRADMCGHPRPHQSRDGRRPALSSDVDRPHGHARAYVPARRPRRRPRWVGVRGAGALQRFQPRQGITSIVAIMPLSSWDKRWQWYTNLPTMTGSVNGMMTFTAPCTGTFTMSWYPSNGCGTPFTSVTWKCV